MAVISREQWEQWAKDDVTLAFREYLQAVAKDSMITWAHGGYTPRDMPLESIGALNIAAAGKVETLYSIAKLDYDEYLDLTKEMQNEE